MLLDSQNSFSNNQKITTTVASENVVKMSDGFLKEISFGTSIPLLIQVVETFIGAASLKVDVQTSADAEFTTPVTLTSSTMNTADLKAGSKFPISFMPKGNLGYMRLYYTPTAETSKTITAGAVTAGVIAGHDNSYQDM